MAKTQYATSMSAKSLTESLAHRMRNVAPKDTTPFAHIREANELVQRLMACFAHMPAAARCRLCNSEAKRLEDTAKLNDPMARSEVMKSAAKTLRVMANNAKCEAEAA